MEPPANRPEAENPKATNTTSGIKRKREDDLTKDEPNHKRPRHTNILSNILRYESEDSSEGEDGSDSSDSSEYDFIKKAREGKAEISSANPQLKDSETIKIKEEVQKVLSNTNQVAQEIFTLLPGAKLAKVQQVMSISAGLRQNKEFKFVEHKDEKKPNNEDYKSDSDDGVTEIKKSELVNREDYEREKLRQHSRADYIKQQHERMARMMPNKDDKSKNNIRALAFDISGTIEADRSTSQKNFINARRKYGW
ncbi:unnamed protein product [Moneuplotes crassus]|uniref:Uncharacterized protein n=1 Tax=Euplotes crassus TaxID=5936 RepID=A0AAD1XRR9_EUPCR|nr:unnamed protein product [Moneuplotes crassus]